MVLKFAKTLALDRIDVWYEKVSVEKIAAKDERVAVMGKKNSACAGSDSILHIVGG